MSIPFQATGKLIAMVIISPLLSLSFPLFLSPSIPLPLPSFHSLRITDANIISCPS